LAAISIGQREFEQWNLDVSALRCVPSGSKSRHFKRQASQEFWNLAQFAVDAVLRDGGKLIGRITDRSFELTLPGSWRVDLPDTPGADPEQQAVFEEHQANAEIAQRIYDLRTEAGLSQRGLAKRVGTTASVICRLEDADYDGHSLSMLRRIAGALNKRVEIRFLPAKRRLQTA
jgi:DNA-binding XRE family transcriptional regulator